VNTKGASELDKSAHRIYTFATGKTEGWYKPGVICPQCGRELETSYCEERVYMVRCPRCKTVAIAAGKSPRNAAEKIGIVATPAEDCKEEFMEAKQVIKELKELQVDCIRQLPTT
jgi:Zn-finger nucleic acid-binding protein